MHVHLMLAALLHPGQALAPHDLLTAWSFDPLVVLMLVASAFLYARGVLRIWQRTQRGRGIRVWQAWTFGVGWLVLALAMLSPLHELSGVLFSAHMTQHELLMVVAAPLIVLGRPLVPSLWALPMKWRKQAGALTRRNEVSIFWQSISAPAAAWLIHAAALWTWHLPGPYQLTLESDFMHTLQHVSFFGTALLFWWALFHGRRGRLSYGASVLYLFTTAMHSGALGALLTFAASPWYPAYEGLTAPWGLTTLEDQQLAGLIMWVPAGIAYLVAALFLIVEWLRESERRAVRWRASALTATSLIAILVTGCGLGSDRQTYERAAALTGGDPEHGKVKLRQYGCTSCHTIPGVAGADRQVGPSLAGIASRVLIAGMLPNQPENMTKWIMNPLAFDPKTAMPNTGVNSKDASDIAAYLYTLK
jgi:cytochrome c oxidase assembly factor CtaG/cytochrome c2